MNEFKRAFRHLAAHRNKAAALFWRPYLTFSTAGMGLSLVALGIGRSVVAPRWWGNAEVASGSGTALIGDHLGWWLLLMVSLATTIAAAWWAHRCCIAAVAQLQPTAETHPKALRSSQHRMKMLMMLVLAAILLGTVLLVAGLPVVVLLASFSAEAQSLLQGGTAITPAWAYAGWAGSSFAWVAMAQLVVFYLRLVFQFSKQS